MYSKQKRKPLSKTRIILCLFVVLMMFRGSHSFLDRIAETIRNLSSIASRSLESTPSVETSVPCSKGCLKCAGTTAQSGVCEVCDLNQGGSRVFDS